MRMSQDPKLPQLFKEVEADLNSATKKEFFKLTAIEAKLRYEAFRAAGFTRIEALSLTIGVPV